MATLQERYSEGRKILEAAKARAKQLFKFYSGEIEATLGRAERYLFSPNYYRDVKRDTGFGYGEEISSDAKKLEKVMTDLMEVEKEWKTVEDEKGSEEYEEALKSFESRLQDFNKEHKQASDTHREAVVAVMKRLRQSHF